MDLSNLPYSLIKVILSWRDENEIEIFVAHKYIFFSSNEDRILCLLTFLGI